MRAGFVQDGRTIDVELRSATVVLEGVAIPEGIQVVIDNHDDIAQDIYVQTGGVALSAWGEDLFHGADESVITVRQ